MMSKTRYQPGLISPYVTRAQLRSIEHDRKMMVLESLNRWLEPNSLDLNSCFSNGFHDEKSKTADKQSYVWMVKIATISRRFSVKTRGIVTLNLSLLSFSNRRDLSVQMILPSSKLQQTEI